MLDAVERSIDPLTDEIQVFKFLNNLYNSARDYERMSTESQIHFALREVEAYSKTLAKIEEQTVSSRRAERKHAAPAAPTHQFKSSSPYNKTDTKKLSRKDNKPKETFL